MTASLADLAIATAWGLSRQSVGEYVAAHRSLYRTILELQSGWTFVDGSKSWRKATLLTRQLEPDVAVSIIHLVRDPRGFAVSARRHDREDLRESAWVWRHLHRRFASLQAIASSYHLVRYEDLCAQPEAEMTELLRFLGLEPQRLVKAPENPAKHHIIGNQMVRTFAGDVSCDEGWRHELSTAEQRMVLNSAGPLASQFGYGSAQGPS